MNDYETKDFLYQKNKHTSGKVVLDKRYVRGIMFGRLLKVFIFLFVIAIAVFLVTRFTSGRIAIGDKVYQTEMTLDNLSVGDTVAFSKTELDMYDRIMIMFRIETVNVAKIKNLPLSIDGNTSKQLDEDTYILEKDDEVGYVKKNQIFGKVLSEKEKPPVWAIWE